ncbi:MAG: hypothetical protein AB1486_14520 [Planctomycetota bacterium]
MAPRAQRVAACAIGGGAAAGVAGLICGYFGTFLLAAEPSNVAPVIGILITGPLGLALGAVVGALLGLTRCPTIVVVPILALVAGGTAALALVATRPTFEPAAELVEGTIVSCNPVTELLAQRLEHWRSEAQRVTVAGFANVRPGWEEDVPAMAAARPGVVLTIHRRHGAWFEERAWGWGTRDRRLGPWVADARTEQVFLPTSIDPSTFVPDGLESRFLLVWERSDDYPPTVLPEFLGLHVIREVPPALSDEELLEWAFRQLRE